MGIDTPLFVMTLNGRKSTIPVPVPWSKRRPYMISYLKKIQPWVIGAQEFTVTQCLDVIRGDDTITGLGEHWNFMGGVKAGNCPIIYNTHKLDYVKDTLIELILDSDLRKRYASIAQFTIRPTGEKVWVGTAHLAVDGITERNAPVLRAKQIARICSTIQGLPDSNEVILCGDFNSGTTKNSYLDSVRKIARTYGLKCLRERISPENISGESYDSHHKFGAKTEQNYRWIDDILTGPGVKPVKAVLHRTCNSVYPKVNPSDHNGISAEIVV